MPRHFDDQVLQLCAKIPKGKVTTYGAIARALKNPHAARAVGNALNKNPTPITVPCHRVVQSNGALGGYAFGSRKKKLLLQKEGVQLVRNTIDLRKYGYYF